MLKPGDKVRVERIEPIGPDGIGEGTVREIGGPICTVLTVDFTVPRGVVDCYVETTESGIWYQWGSRRSRWKITKL